MNCKATLLFLLISLLPLSGLGQDHAWRLRHSGTVTTVGINPLNPNTIFTVLHTFDDQEDSLIVSYDRGLTWGTRAILPPSPYLRTIFVHTVDTLVIFGTNPNVMRSSDYGLTWNLVLDGSPSSIVPFVIDPIHPDTLFAGREATGEVYRSIDRGITWELISEVGPDLCSLAIRPDSTNILYAGWAGKISKSTDGGFSWRLTTTTNADDIPFIVIDFSNPFVAYTTGHFEGPGISVGLSNPLSAHVTERQENGSVWMTTDGGEHWDPASAPGNTYWYMDIDRSSPAIPYITRLAGSDMIRSTDQGASWEIIDQAPFSWSEDLRVHPLDGDFVWIAGSGIYRWVPLVSTVRGMVLDDETGEPVTNGFVELVSTGERVLLDTSGGSFAFHYYEDDPGMITTIHVEAFPYYMHDEPIEFIADSSIALTISLDTADVLITSSSGSGDFTQFYTDILDSLGLTFYFWDPGIQGVAPLSRAAEMRKNIAIYYAGNDDQSLPQAELDSLDEALQSGVHLFITGQNFVEANASSKFVSLRLGVSHAGNTTLTECRGVGGELLSDLLLTTSGGTGANNQTSRDILQIEDSLAIPVIGYDSLGTDGTAAIRRDGTADGGKVVLFGFGFEAISSLQTREEVMQTILGYLDSSIVLSVHENAPLGLPSSYRLEQNYPNPFNPSTSIRYALPVKSHVLLEVFDVLGKRVTVLIDGEQEAGYHSAVLKGQGLASGLYFYRLQSGNFSETRKLLLLR